jgi:hypothetical protein
MSKNGITYGILEDGEDRDMMATISTFRWSALSILEDG